ncbi:MAG: glycosyltransferase, partial [Flavobacteriales bacterium]|nr:glycosyltransferase [Flavobacteriales bacterium]
IISQCGAFILPSTREPWGVVVQEMAASGLPLLCTDRVGAAHAFLRENENGWKFKASDRQSLTNALTQLFETSDESLVVMGEKSREISQIINHDTWVKTALQLSGVHNA